MRDNIYSAHHEFIIKNITVECSNCPQTAKNLQAFFYTLAKNPDKQEILRREILEVVGDSGVVDAKALSKMSYLKHCLKESFR